MQQKFKYLARELSHNNIWKKIVHEILNTVSNCFHRNNSSLVTLTLSRIGNTISSSPLKITTLLIVLNTLYLKDAEHNSDAKRECIISCWRRVMKWNGGQGVHMEESRIWTRSCKYTERGDIHGRCSGSTSSGSIERASNLREKFT